MSPILGIIASSKFAAVGDFESIATVTVGSGGAANVEFTSIPGTYTHLQIRLISSNTGANNQSSTLIFNSDTGSNYSYHRLYGTGSGTGADAAANASGILVAVETNTSSTFGASIIDVLDYKNTDKYKTVRSLTGWENNSDGRLFFLSGNWRSTSAITSIKITPQTNNFAQYSHFALYGCKSA